jgi:hypothetical protein
MTLSALVAATFIGSLAFTAANAAGTGTSPSGLPGDDPNAPGYPGPHRQVVFD